MWPCSPGWAGSLSRTYRGYTRRHMAEPRGRSDRGAARPSAAEAIAAITLALSAIYIAINETAANWQALWLGAVLLVLAATLARSRGARSS